MQRHSEGVTFRERNAGHAIDNDMSDAGERMPPTRLCSYLAVLVSCSKVTNEVELFEFERVVI